MKMQRFLLSLALLLTCGTVSAQIDLGRVFSGVKNLGSAVTGISEKEEIDIGRDLAGRMLGAVQLVDDPDVQAYVNRVGRWIASQSERPDLPWRFGVANAPNVNAMAMPGGIILITRGLYDLLDNEAQLAGVLGHEIAHVVKRHHVTVMQKQSAVAGVANLASAKSGNNQLSQMALDTFKEMFTKGLDKSAEYEADEVGVILAARAGYSAFGLVEVLHKMNANRDDAGLAFLFETHPSPEDRLQKLGDVLTPRVDGLPQGLEPAITTVAEGVAPPAATSATPVGARGFDASPPKSAPRQAPKPAPASSSGNPLDALKGLKGLFGR
jgi:beta-barrel assembly-enhancing protease